MGIEEVIIAERSPWQSPYVERMIGSIRRECLDNVVVLGERHLRRILRDYLAHYQSWRCHQSLEMDCFEPRAVQPPEVGEVALGFAVGIVGGIYGIGGGAIIAPVLVAFLAIPVYTVAGAALMGTFITSVAGLGLYQLLALRYTGQNVAPDWLLGLSFGAGGFVGMYLGARCQRYVPSRAIEFLLCGCVLFVALRYVVGFFWG